MFDALPHVATFGHRGAREGFEVTFFRPETSGTGIVGSTSAAERGRAWVIGYVIHVDPQWCTKSVRAMAETTEGPFAMSADRTLEGVWLVDGAERPDLEGCVDVDFESSLVTNALPVHRLPRRRHHLHQAAAAYVRADDLRVERLEQTYMYVGGDERGHIYDYTSPTFGFACQLTYDKAGLIREYPGLGRRHS